VTVDRGIADDAGEEFPKAARRCNPSAARSFVAPTLAERIGQRATMRL
jgi:hypothetical protein